MDNLWDINVFFPEIYVVIYGKDLGNIWVNHNDLTIDQTLGIMVNFREIIPLCGRTIQVSEIL